MTGNALDDIYFDNTLGQWLTAAGVFLTSALALWIVGRFALRRFTRFASQTQTSIDDLVAEVLGQTKVVLLLLVATFFASIWLTMPPHVTLVIRRAAAIAVVIQGGIWTVAAITFWVDRFVARSTEDDPGAVTTVSAMSFVGRLSVWVIVLLLILDNLGVEVTALLTGLGIGGIAVALAVKDVLGDLLASLSIVLDRPFVIGDFLVVGEFKGTVEHVGLKTTRLRSATGEQVVLGNNDLLGSRIRNLGRMGDRRGDLSIGVTYDTPRQMLERIPGWIEEIIEAQDDTRHDRSHLTAFGPYSVDFETVYYVTVPEYKRFMDVKQAIHLAIHERFEREGIEFAYPTQVVYTMPAGSDVAEGA
ncbi:MAG: mechanosensitive ion channel family protein [Gemmatimonadota bacterium]